MRQFICCALTSALIIALSHGVSAQSVVPPPSAGSIPAISDAAPQTPAQVLVLGTITGNGSAVIRPKVDMFRMQLQLVARGKTVDEALDRLKARRAAAIEKLAKLGAAEDAVEVGRIVVTRSNQPGQFAEVQSSIGPPVICSPCVPTPSSVSVPPAAAAPPTLGPISPIPMPANEPARPVPVSPFDPYSSSGAPVPNSPLTPPPGAVPPTVEKPAVGETGFTVQPPVARPVASAPSFSAPIVPPPPTYSLPGPVTSIYPPPTIPPPATFVTVMASLTADWKLRGENQEAVLRESEALKQKIEAADLLGMNGDEELSPEEQTLRTTSGDSARIVVPMPVPSSIAMSCSPAPTSNSRGICGAVPPVIYPAALPAPSTFSMVDCSPKFVFVARVSNEQRKAALAEAFKEAKRHAAELAEASGGSLGTLQTVREESLACPLGPIFYPAESPSIPSPGFWPLAEGKGHENEVQAASETDLFDLIQITAVFRLQ
jgi:uncharacterized protein YggE